MIIPTHVAPCQVTATLRDSVGGKRYNMRSVRIDFIMRDEDVTAIFNAHSGYQRAIVLAHLAIRDLDPGNRTLILQELLAEQLTES
jgi:hypothetical protein